MKRSGVRPHRSSLHDAAYNQLLSDRTPKHIGMELDDRFVIARYRHDVDVRVVKDRIPTKARGQRQMPSE